MPNQIAVSQFMPEAGASIERAAQEACALAAQQGSDVSMSFNGLEMTITPTSTPSEVESEFWRMVGERSSKYWTPERLQQKAADEEAERAIARAWVAGLSEVDMQDLDACIRWLCGLERVATVHTKSVIDRDAVLAHFARSGLHPAMDRRLPEESTEDWLARVGQEGRKRWLIGQSLEGIVLVGAPHQMVHTFARELGTQP